MTSTNLDGMGWILAIVFLPIVVIYGSFVYILNNLIGVPGIVTFLATIVFILATIYILNRYGIITYLGDIIRNGVGY